MFKIKQEPV